jgi:hypothetical protein
MAKKQTSKAVAVTSERNAVIRAAAAGPGADATPDYQEIASRAYGYWEARGGQGGSPEEDWLRAEQEVRDRKEHPRLPAMRRHEGNHGDGKA